MQIRLSIPSFGQGNTDVPVLRFSLLQADGVTPAVDANGVEVQTVNQSADNITFTGLSNESATYVGKLEQLDGTGAVLADPITTDPIVYNAGGSTGETTYRLAQGLTATVLDDSGTAV